jgi:hypothetical protein
MWDQQEQPDWSGILGLQGQQELELKGLLAQRVLSRQMSFKTTQLTTL